MGIVGNHCPALPSWNPTKPLGAVEAGIAMHVTVLLDWNALDGVGASSLQGPAYEDDPEQFLSSHFPKSKFFASQLQLVMKSIGGSVGQPLFHLINLDSMIAHWKRYLAERSEASSGTEYMYVLHSREYCTNSSPP